MEDVNSPLRLGEIKARIQEKALLHYWYINAYEKFSLAIADRNRQNLIVEIGSGGSFLKEIIPEVIYTDVINYAGIDKIVDATKMPFSDSSLEAIFMMNVFHHIPNVEKFLKETERCLVPNGTLFILDHYLGPISWFLMKYIHHEAFDPKSREWNFQSTGPLSSANTALAHIVFQRDFKKFKKLYPKLVLHSFTPHSPLSYWISGGLKKWSLVPRFLTRLFWGIDQSLGKAFPWSCSFVNIVIKKTD